MLVFAFFVVLSLFCFRTEAGQDVREIERSEGPCKCSDITPPLNKLIINLEGIKGQIIHEMPDQKQAEETKKIVKDLENVKGIVTVEIPGQLIKQEEKITKIVSNLENLANKSDKSFAKIANDLDDVKGRSTKQATEIKNNQQYLRKIETSVENVAIRSKEISENLQLYDQRLQEVSNKGPLSCKSIKDDNPKSPSGTYTIVTSAKKKLQVYCEMGLNGGGYTFLHPMMLSTVNDLDIAPIFTDRSTFLLRARRTNGSQPYAVLGQLKEFSNVSLSLGISRHEDFSDLRNKIYIGKPFTHFGFVPDSISTRSSILGLQVNGVRLSYQHCGNVYASHFTLFPNFNEKATWTGYYPDSVVYPGIFNNLLNNPSGRAMPTDFFMFGEIHFGGCGCYVQTDQMGAIGVLSMAIGFR